MRPYEPELFACFETFLTTERKQRLRDVLARRTRQLCVVLDGIYHPHNTSAVFRSADAFGIQDVHLVENAHAQQVSRKVAGGSDKWLTTSRYSGDAAADECIATLRDRGYSIVTTAAVGGGSPASGIDLSQPVALVLGNEATGVSAAFSVAAAAEVTIPTVGFVESLNLSVAAAILISQLTERLRASEVQWQLTLEEQEELLYLWTQKSVPFADDLSRRWRRTTGRAGR